MGTGVNGEVVSYEMRVNLADGEESLGGPHTAETSHTTVSLRSGVWRDSRLTGTVLAVMDVKYGTC